MEMRVFAGLIIAIAVFMFTGYVWPGWDTGGPPPPSPVEVCRDHGGVNSLAQLGYKGRGPVWVTCRDGYATPHVRTYE